MKKITRLVFVVFYVILVPMLPSGVSAFAGGDGSSLLINSFHVGAQTSPTNDCNVTTLSVGYYHTVGLKEDGTVVAVGSNMDGQLNVSGWTNIKSIAGGLHTVGLKEDGTVVAVGSNMYGALNVSGWTNIKSISAGFWHTVGLKEDGTVVAVGYNRNGELDVSGWTNIKSISAGAGHTVGLKEDGTVVATGSNEYGQLNVSEWTNIKSISAGYWHTVGLKEDGTVVAVGSNMYGEMNVSGWTSIKSISAGYWHTVGLEEDGTVVAVGSNMYGEMDVSGWTNIKSISAGALHTAGLKEDGTVVAVGLSGYGELNVSGWTNIRQPCYLPPTGNTQPGTNVSVIPDPNVTITFKDVTGTGNTAATVSNTNPGSEKTDFKFLGAYYDILTTATYSGPLTICLNYDDSHIPAGREKTLKIFHWDGAQWIDATVSLDTVNNIICARVSSLSWFAAAYELDSLAPTTNISLSGTLGKNGWYVSSVQVALTATDNEGGSGVAKTEYSFDGITWNPYAAPFVVSTEGTISVYYRSTDNAGNIEETKTKPIKIDKTPPVPEMQILPDLSGECSINITTFPTATDICDGKIIGTTNDPLQYANQGTYTIHWTYTDRAGNVSNQNQSVIVKDTIAPTINASAPECVPYGKGNSNKANKITVTAQDNCSKNVILQITKVEVFNNGGNLVTGNGIYEISGNIVYVNPNGNGWSVRITAIATDENRNTAQPVQITKALIKC